MNRLLILTIILSLSTFLTTAQDLPEKDVKTEIKSVTVFVKGAQIHREKKIQLNKGKVLLKFTDLSPFIDAKSLQVRAKGKITVLSVNHHQNFLDKHEKSPTLAALEAKLKEINHQIRLENTHLEIMEEELAFLQENRQIGGRDQEVSMQNLKDAADFYGTKLTSIKMMQIERRMKIFDLNAEKNDIKRQIKTLSNQADFTKGEIHVKVDAATAGSADFEISYLVGQAGWLPSYDLRAKNVNEPIELIYKAKVHQQTKVDWKNVKLSFSSADPNVSGVAPQLITYFLNYQLPPPRYSDFTGEVRGVVTDDEGLPLPGTNIMVSGTTIGTITDFDGKYNLTLPKGKNQLEFTFVGYTTITKMVNSNQLNVQMELDTQSLDEVVVTGYGMSKRGDLSEELSGKAAGIEIKGANSIAVPMVQVENQTSVNFEIDRPYTVLSDNQSYSVDMMNYQLPASYQYYTVPKIKTDAYLLATIRDWEQYNLLEGEANIFFEDTYVGKTLLDVRYASDSLQISLGRDKNVVVSREKASEFTAKRMIGSRKEELRDWKISVKNNKSEKINLLVLDQIPVATITEIKVELLEKSGAVFYETTGEIKWNFSLDSNSKKDLQLKYQVKYPKSKNLLVE